MGSNQSQKQKEDEKKTSILTIDRSEIPEAYQFVHVTENVLNQMNSQNLNDSNFTTTNNNNNNNNNSKLSEELEYKKNVLNADDTLEDAKRIFKETVEKVDKQFFNYRRENVCAENEQEILNCLKKNENKILNCKSLWLPYNNCISDFHKSVLNEKLLSA